VVQSFRRIAVQAVLICFLVIVVNYKAFTVPSAGAITIRRECKSSVVINAVLVAVLGVPNNQKAAAIDLRLLGISSVRKMGAPYRVYDLVWGKSDSDGKPFWSLGRPEFNGIVL